MSDIASMFKSEIARLSKKTVRQHTEALRSATTAHRHQLAALKKQVAGLERELSKLRRVAVPKAVEKPAEDVDTGKVRFVAKGLKSLRTRLGLSAEDFARLIDVSTQSIYNWEARKTTPRPAQVAAIAALRGLGKKDASARLELIAKEAPKAKGKAKAKAQKTKVNTKAKPKAAAKATPTSRKAKVSRKAKSAATPAAPKVRKPRKARVSAAS
ncbi:helix-turn-helix domain-containing protein [Flagellatimonas centrodinii]|uniref:helix-turn-helix domain-containing protein n=1 Tax=Flagellatimonas centrodinii TaxID=2806210 RepID=UPI001FFBC13A|nr:helix-turn-helix transcriptional regulator [Flagellatimonas centrodinii]ULQ46617.1 helix-turn-helix domain-containing protein [Flagellatimonas centrodinii]